MGRSLSLIVLILILSCSSTNELKDVKIGSDIGDLAPNFSLAKPNGELQSFYELKGKVTLIDFWASWCRPCRYENKNLVKTFKQYENAKFQKSKGFQIISVSFDHTKSQWIKGIKADNLYWEHHLSDLKFWNCEAGQIYKINSIPSNFLINEQGIIIGKNLFGNKLDLALEKLLKKD